MMKRMEFLNKVEFYKNAIDVYNGPDPLQPRYEYIMWLEKNVGKENADIIACLEQTLQKFQTVTCYVNDTRFVELLILFSQLKGDKLKYFEKLTENKLGVKCSILYKAWSDEFIKARKCIEAYNVLENGIKNNAQPLDLLTNAKRELLIHVGARVIAGGPECAKLGIPWLCYNSKEKVETVEVKNWEMNPLKPGEPDNFTCPMYIHEPDCPNKRVMYCKNQIYNGMNEYQFEEIQAMKYYEKLENAKKKLSTVVCDSYPTTPNPPSSPNHKEQQLTDVSCGAQSFTAHTRAALNLIGDMWGSPAPSEESKPKEIFKVPDVPKVNSSTTPFVIFTDSIHEEPENAGVTSSALSGPKSAKGRLSARKLLTQPLGEQMAGGSSDRGPVKHQLAFGEDPDEDKPEALATYLDPNLQKSLIEKKEAPNDWCMDDVTCNTKVFTNFLTFSSTPNTKGKEPLAAQPHTGQNVHQSTGGLSTILEASKETPSSGSSGNENRMANILEVERTLENLDINSVQNPFCTKLNERLLQKINYPYNLTSAEVANYHVINSRIPNLTKTLKLGENVYCLTGETIKGSYAKVLKVSLNDKLYALKIEKPACHWEYYICKEIRKRLEPEKAVYFTDISSAFFFQNGSIFVSEYAKYGSLLNVINQSKLSSCKVDYSIWLLFAMEVTSAIHYLNTQCNIIHGDIKPDNFVVQSLSTTNFNGPFVKLIDFGRSIDMRLLPKGCEFTYSVSTDGFQCIEMKENRPWTYQTDLYGLAGTLYCILVGDYMKVIKKKDVYTLVRQLPRCHQLLWNPIFAVLLNIESSNSLPDLMEIWKILKASFDKYDAFTIRNSISTLINVLRGN